jgi:hypothetical protein
LSLAGNRFVHGHVDQVKRAAMAVWRVVIQGQIVAGNQLGHAVIGVTVTFAVGGSQVGARESGGVDLLHRRKVNESEATAENP